MSTPKISVLMPIYNTKEKYLKEAIESILNQTYKDFEFLILNDSPDNKRLDDIVAIYSSKDNRIKYIKNDKNLGITISRNKLIDLSQGEYLAVMDHDDISLPERFEKQLNYLEENRDVGVVGCQGKTFGIKKTKMKYFIDNNKIKLSLVKKCEILHPASMIRKSVLINNNLKYEQQFSPAEDYALWCRLIPYTKFHNLNEILFKYRLHINNTSKKQKIKMVNSSDRVYKMVKDNYPELVNEFLLNSIHKRRFNLFGIIPIITVVNLGSKRTIIYLFDKIPIITIKDSYKLF